ncbi:hypothetical protein HNR65_002136 [Desulfosalsimonas propionicica]|uniref:Antirepressor protein ant N-terminal domain-containing protein n=1 Tax=Desulfosalsimonas propionicica TaxID=332175 RepID=A0A7W0C9T7_9BACT|nr:phage antirepressor N-terminal domain-containing protein [Desulfosalsimonas propionicica]MBA2881805.1 hypothetical protein [Desulfosalsimonas propionicica]
MTDRKHLTPVSFHGDTIYTVEHEGEPYAPVRPIVENMGLAWPPQREKLRRQADRWGVTIIVTPSSGGSQETVCIPVRKVAGFLATINHNKVKNGLRAKVLAYQRECDDALWDYWTRTQKRDLPVWKGLLARAGDGTISPSQRIRLLSLAMRFARMGRAEQEAAAETYAEFCRRAGRATAQAGAGGLPQA